MKKNKKKRHKQNKNEFDVLDIQNFIEPLLDLETNITMKEVFGICPIEFIYLILKYPNSKL